MRPHCFCTASALLAVPPLSLTERCRPCLLLLPLLLEAAFACLKGDPKGWNLSASAELLWLLVDSRADSGPPRPPQLLVWKCVQAPPAALPARSLSRSLSRSRKRALPLLLLPPPPPPLVCRPPLLAAAAAAPAERVPGRSRGSPAGRVLLLTPLLLRLCHASRC